MIIVVSWKDFLVDLKVNTTADRATADALVESMPSERTAYVADTTAGENWAAKSFADFASNRLVDLYNALCSPEDIEVKRFENKETAFRRIGHKLNERAQNSLTEEINMSKDKDTIKKPMINEAHTSKPVWRKMRSNTMRGRIVKAMLDNGPSTIANIAVLAGVPEDRVMPHIYATWRDCGIGYSVNDEKYELDLPPGAEDIFISEESAA